VTARTIQCSCGIVHRDITPLKKVGWQDLFGGGEWALLVNCTCGSTIAADLIVDAAPCEECRRLVLGTIQDPKIWTEGIGVRCAGCARRAGLVMPVAIAFQAWVKQGDVEALKAWRSVRGHLRGAA
jgi:hypothetical protein